MVSSWRTCERRQRMSGVVVATAVLALAGTVATAPPSASAGTASSDGLPSLVPQPVSVTAGTGGDFSLASTTEIAVRPGDPRAVAVAEYLAVRLRASTGYPLPVTVAAEPVDDAIVLDPSGSEGLGAEGYALRADSERVSLTAGGSEGLFRGVQTLRQLLPPKAEAATTQPGPWTVPGVEIRDEPRFEHRGAMLDVSRHFFSVAEVKRYIDVASLYKVNTLHLHLSDDQGWRVVIDSWPRLAEYGGSTEVGGGPGGYYTKAQYADIIRYAASRYMTVVPEIDTPGHTNAALASYAELNCDGKAPPLYTGTSVGFSSLCIPKDITYKFLDDVWRELSAMSPGPYAHMGGDEAHVTTEEDYLTFMRRAMPVINSYGKRVMGWQEISAAESLPAGTRIQYWGTDDRRSADLTRLGVRKGAKVVMSPANRAYLDMKYDPSTPYGLTWAGYVPVEKSYDWDPARQVAGVAESDIAGVEAPLWSETIDEIDEAEFMAYPRLPGIAELGWSPASTHDWETYRHRLASQAPRWDVMGVDYYRAPDVPWS